MGNRENTLKGEREGVENGERDGGNTTFSRVFKRGEKMGENSDWEVLLPY